MKYKKVKTLSTTKRAYIAGLIDDEGTIALTRRRKNENRRVGVIISNNEEKMLLWVKRAVGVGQITSKKSYRKPWMRSFAYQLYSEQALALLKQTAPYLQTYKQKRAR